MNPTVVVRTCLQLLYLVKIMEAIQCFQCAASKAGSACESDIQLLGHDRLHGGHFNKNCSLETDQRYCMIETSRNRGEVSTFLRDCSDGKTFSINNIDRLQAISPTNQTTCATFGTSGTVICISVCATDFCNGPVETVNMAILPRVTSGLLVAMASLVYLVSAFS